MLRKTGGERVAKQTKIRESAKGESCSLRLSPNCTDEYGAVVLCHVGRNIGIAIKCGDNMAVYACNHCHDIIDGRSKSGFGKLELDSEKLRALEETQIKLIAKGLMCLK